MNTKQIPSVNSLLAKIPSGREIHSIPDYKPPYLDGETLDMMRGPANNRDDVTNDFSSDDDGLGSPQAPGIGGFPTASGDYGRSSTPQGSHTYY